LEPGENGSETAGAEGPDTTTEVIMNQVFAALYVWTMLNTDKAIDKLRARRESGQGTLEYVGMIAVAALVVVAVITVLKGIDLGNIVTQAVQKVTSALGFGG